MVSFEICSFVSLFHLPAICSGDRYFLIYFKMKVSNSHFKILLLFSLFTLIFNFFRILIQYFA